MTIYIYIYVYTYIHTCVHVYVYINIYMYIYTIYLCIFLGFVTFLLYVRYDVAYLYRSLQRYRHCHRSSFSSFSGVLCSTGGLSTEEGPIAIHPKKGQ